MGEIAGGAADGMDNRRCPLLIANGGLGGGAIRIGITIGSRITRLLQNSVLQEPYSGFRIQDSE
jgi:hypothetical protein